MSVAVTRSLKAGVDEPRTTLLQLRAPRGAKLEKPRPLRQTTSEDPLSSLQVRAPRGKKLEKPRPLRQKSTEQEAGNLSEERHKHENSQKHDSSSQMIDKHDKENRCSFPQGKTETSLIFDQLCNGDKTATVTEIVSHFTKNPRLYENQKSSDSGFADGDLDEDMVEMEERFFKESPTSGEVDIKCSEWPGNSTPKHCDKFVSVRSDGRNAISDVSDDLLTSECDRGTDSVISRRWRETHNNKLSHCNHESMQEEFTAHEPCSKYRQLLDSHRPGSCRENSTMTRIGDAVGNVDDLDWNDLTGESYMFGSQQLAVLASEVNKAVPFNSLNFSNTVDFKDGTSAGKSYKKRAEYNGVSQDLVPTRTESNTGGTSSFPVPVSEGIPSNSWTKELAEIQINKNAMLDYRNVPEIPSSDSLSPSGDSLNSSILEESSNETMFVWELIEDLSDRVGRMSVVDESRHSDASSGIDIDSEQEYVWDLIDRQNTSCRSVRSVKRNKTFIASRNPIGPGTSKDEINEIEATQPNGKLSAKIRRRMFRFYLEAVTTSQDSVEDRPDERPVIGYTTEELLSYSRSSHAHHAPPEWSYLVKIFPEVCLHQADEYFDANLFLQSRKQFSWGGNSGFDSNWSGLRRAYSDLRTNALEATTGSSKMRGGFPPPKQAQV
ncbi:hypothetical protein ScPMuIL_002006 [Solemya velum]